jgi:hypothetical protein
VVTTNLWPATDGPATDNDTDPISLGTEFAVLTSAWITGIRVWRATPADTGITAAIFLAVGSTPVAGTTVTVPDAGLGWIDVLFPTAVPASTSTRYVATAHHQSKYSGTGGYWLTGNPGGSGITQNAFLYAPGNDAIPGSPIGQGRYEVGATLVAPTQTYNGACYWVTPITTDVDPGGRSGTATLTATGAITSTGAKGGRGTGAILGASALTDAGRTGRAGTATILGTATAASTGTAQRRGTGTLTGVGTLSGTGISRRTGTSAVAATGALTSTGRNPDNINARLYRAGEPTTTWTCGPPLT